MSPKLAVDSGLPSVSFIIPTYNSHRTLAECLESIDLLDYPKERLEVIIADGGSKDDTLEIATRFGVSKMFHNPLRTGEAGKALGIEGSTKEILAFVDSDNVLTSKNWLRAMVAPFGDEQVAASEPLWYSLRTSDPTITRYCALTGMNDILCLFLGNYDRYCYLTRRWTGMTIDLRDEDGHLFANLTSGNLPTVGANGFLIRSKIIKQLGHHSFFFDVDVVSQLTRARSFGLAKVKIGIIHLFADGISLYMRKTYRRIRDYLFYRAYAQRSYPWDISVGLGIYKFFLYTLSVFPLLIQLNTGYRTKPDRAWLFHPVACWVTLLTYGSYFVSYKVARTLGL